MSNKQIVRNGDQFQRMLNFLELSPFLTFDTETSGTAWYRHAKTIGYALAGMANGVFKCFYVPIRHRTGESQFNFGTVKEGFSKLFQTPKKLKIAHNFKFDEHMLRVDGITIEGPRYDTMIAARLYDENRPAKLKTRAVEDLQIHDAIHYESIINQEVDYLAKLNNMKKEAYKYQYGYSHLPIDLCGTYACFDVDFTTQLYLFYETFGVSTKYPRIFNTEMNLLSCLCNMEDNGMYINTIYLEELKSKLKIRQTEIEEGLFYHLRIPQFNIASDDELRKYLIEQLGLQLTELTKEKKLSVDKNVLDSFKQVHPSIPLIAEWREIDKLANTYTNSIIKRLDHNSMLHCDFQQVGTIASRLSCANPNLQNQPSDSDKRAKQYTGLSLEDGGKDPWSIRRAYELPSKEFVRIYSDYSQIELRVLTFYSQDPILVDSYLKNEDVHSRTSLEVFKTKEKAKRRYAKIINFGLPYGMQEIGFARQAKIPIEEATSYLAQFFNRYVGIVNFKEEFFQYLRNNGGYFENLFGRPRRINEINSDIEGVRKRGERKAIASQIQGTAGELTKESIVRLFNRIDREGWKDLVYPVCTIHDEVQSDVHISILPEYCRAIKEEMENYPEFGNIPIIVDGEYTVTDWSEKQKLPGE